MGDHTVAEILRPHRSRHPDLGIGFSLFTTRIAPEVVAALKLIAPGQSLNSSCNIPITQVILCGDDWLCIGLFTRVVTLCHKLGLLQVQLADQLAYVPITYSDGTAALFDGAIL